MIIKMRFYDGWKFFGDIATIYSVQYNPDDPSPDMSIYEEVAWWLPDSGSTPSMFIDSRRHDGKRILIVSSEAVYLLNDNGKTIERLN